MEVTCPFALTVTTGMTVEDPTDPAGEGDNAAIVGFG
jgi:hypothetical protein